MVVSSVDETVRRYHDEFGIGPWSIYEFNKENVEGMALDGEESDFSMRIGLTNIGDVRIELIEPLDDKTIYSKFLKEHGEGLHHIAYGVDDFKKARELFKSKGIKVNQEGKWMGRHHFAYLESESQLKHIAEIYDTQPDFFKFEIDENGVKKILYPEPLETYPPE
jgi:hypothetical protein